MGIAQRHIRAAYAHILRKQDLHKPLNQTTKAIGQVIQDARLKKGMACYQLAVKMGIATSLVHSWERGECEPDELQRRILGDLLGWQLAS